MNNKDRDFIIKVLKEGRAVGDYGTPNTWLDDFDKAIKILEDDKLDVVVNAKTNPAAVGEYLRNEFFDQNTEGDSYTYSYGCYSTFELRDDVTALPSEPVTYPCECMWRYNKGNTGLGAYSGPADKNCPECKGAGEINEGFNWTVAEKDNITMRYYWDGDGQLVFELPDGSAVVNTDCKKSHTWDWEENYERR